MFGQESLNTQLKPVNVEMGSKSKESSPGAERRGRILLVYSFQATNRAQQEANSMPFWMKQPMK